jgi:hypothetical protein
MGQKISGLLDFLAWNAYALNLKPSRLFISYIHDFICNFPKTLKMGQTSDPETLVMHQKMTPGNNPEDFKQHPWLYSNTVKWDFRET